MKLRKLECFCVEVLEFHKRLVQSQFIGSKLFLCGIFFVKKALYGLKSAGAAFRALLAETLYDMGYAPPEADPDVWLRPAVKTDGFQYYELVLCYVDVVLAISMDPANTLNALKTTFTLKDNKIESPEMYLGAQLGKLDVDAVSFWTMSAEKYVTAAVKNVEEALSKRGLRLLSKCYTPMPTDYKPELETSPELKADGVQYYQELIGIHRWAVELGRVDILLETSLKDPKRKLAFDPQHPKISKRMFTRYEWQDFYCDV